MLKVAFTIERYRIHIIGCVQYESENRPYYRLSLLQSLPERPPTFAPQPLGLTFHRPDVGAVRAGESSFFAANYRRPARRSPRQAGKGQPV